MQLLNFINAPKYYRYESPMSALPRLGSRDSRGPLVMTAEIRDRVHCTYFIKHIGALNEGPLDPTLYSLFELLVCT